MRLLGGIRDAIGAELYARARLAQVMAARERDGDSERRGLSWRELWGRGMERLAVYGEVQNPYTQVDTVYNAISTIGTNGSSVPYYLTSAGDAKDRIEDPNHPVYTILRKPNPLQRGPQLLEGTLIHLEAAGKAYWLLDEFTRAGGQPFPRRIRLLDPNRVEPVKDPSGDELVAWKFRRPGTGESITLSLDQVIRFAYYDPADPFDGMAPLKAARLGYSLAWKATAWQERFYAGGAVPPFWVKVPADANVGPAEQRRLKSEFRREYGGIRNAGKVPLLFNGAELASIAVNQTDAEWLATVKLTREQILGVFKVPPGVAGILEYANYANMGPQLRFFWHNCMAPKLVLLASVLQADFVDRFAPGLAWAWALRAKLSELIPEDVHKSIEAASELWGMGVPAAEAFAYLGLELDTAGKPWLETGWLEFNRVPAEQAMLPPEDTDDPDEETDPDEDDAGDEKTARRALEAGRRAWPTGTEARGNLWRGYARVTGQLERQLLGDWRKWLLWLRDQVLQRLEQRAIAGPLEGLPHLAALLRSTDDLLPSDEARRASAVKLTAPGVRRSIAAGYKAVLAEAGIQGDFDWADPEVANVLNARAQTILGASDRATNRLRAAIAEGLDAGEGTRELAKRVRGQIREQYSGQALTVARTEANGAFSNARAAAMGRHGISKRQWLSSRDARVRDTHSRVDGETIVDGQIYGNGLEHPHQPGAPASEVVNCFPAGTPVLTARGEIPIEAVRCGDVVLTHGNRWRPVVERHENRRGSAVVEVALESGRAFRVTPAHKLYVLGRGWVEAGALQRGDQLLDPAALAAVHDSVGHVEHPHPELLNLAVAERPEDGLVPVDLHPRAQLREVEVDVVRGAGAAGPDLPLRFDADAAGLDPLAEHDLSGTRLLPVDEAARRAMAAQVRRSGPPAGAGTRPLVADRFAPSADRDTQERHHLSQGAGLGEAEVAHDLAVAGALQHVPAPQPSADWQADLVAPSLGHVQQPVRVVAVPGAKADPTIGARVLHLEGARAVVADDENAHAALHGSSVHSVSPVPGLHDVFNLGVAEDMSYFAAGVLGRNCRCVELPVVEA
jgi:HK97 family phage portal protein